MAPTFSSLRALAWPLGAGRVAAVRRIPARAAAASFPTGSGCPVHSERNRSAATVLAAVAGDFPAPWR